MSSGRVAQPAHGDGDSQTHMAAREFRRNVLGGILKFWSCLLSECNTTSLEVASFSAHEHTHNWLLVAL